MPINNNTISQDVTNISRLEQVLNSQGKKQLLALTTLDSTNKAKSDEMVYIAKNAEDMATLTPPTDTSGQNDYLKILVAGLSSFMKIQANALIMQDDEFVNLQQLDKTMANAVLISTNQAIKDEKKQLDWLIGYTDQQAQASWVSGWVKAASFAIIAVIIVATLAATILTGGAAAPLLAGEIAGETTLEGGGVAIEMADLAVTDVASEITEEAMSEESMQILLDEGSVSTDSSGAPTTSQTIRTGARKVASGTRTGLTKTAQLLKTKTGKFLTAFGVSTASSAPLFTTAWAQKKVAIAKTAQAEMEQQVGASTGTLTMFNGFLDFWQQSLQQMAGTIQATAKDYGSTASSMAALFSGYDQISAALRQAV